MITTCCIDVGLRNLSLCIMNSNYEILLWNIYDVFETCEKTCTAKMKNDKICNKKCSYKYNNIDNIESYSCKLHFPKNIKMTNKNKITLKKIDKYLLQEIAFKFISKIEEIYNTNIDIFKSLNSIYIELQPKCNPKMLFISHILYGKLIELFKHDNTIIRFIRATQKLKSYDGPPLVCNLKGKYAQRKWYSIQYAKWFLENKINSSENEKWYPFFQDCKKKDDISDSLNFAVNILIGVCPSKLKHKNGNELK